MNILRVAKNTDSESSVVKELTLRTKNFQTVQAACKFARDFKRLVGLCGDPGLGKTVGLSYFFRNHPNVFMLTAKPSMSGKTFWLELLGKVCVGGEEERFSFDHRNLYFMLKRICTTFNEMESPLLIIDEAGKLSDKMLLHVHELRDETKSNLGIVISGPNYFRDNFYKWAARNKHGIPELLTRINSWIKLDQPTYFEFKKVCEAYGIADVEAIKSLCSKVNNFRSLHNKITEFTIENT